MKRDVLALLLLALVVALSVFGLWNVQIQPPSKNVVVEITSGEGLAAVSAQVAQLGITRLPQTLRWYWQLRRGGALHEGRYPVGGVRTLDALFEAIAHKEPMTARVTIPEGFTVRAIAERLQEQAGIPEEEFLAVAVDEKGVTLEGFLFPDTYEFLYGGDAGEAVARMEARFQEVLPADFAQQARKRGLTEKQLVTVASIVEREAKFDVDRPLVASVIFNRLRSGMLLQMDSTLGYVLPAHGGFYTAKELATDSPYNTYVHAGLPPTPICNPGLASLTAAAHAPTTPYYYFLAKPDGHCVYARTYAEHLRNVHRYISGGD